ncbi:MAG: isoamylase, partial [Variibacter sp.]|nr:isoamylase [Variibacter sp.]
WLRGQLPDGSHDVMWLTTEGAEMAEPDWRDSERRFLAYVLGARDGAPGPLFIAMNAAAAPVEFKLPKWPKCSRWKLALATQSTADEAGTELAPLSTTTAPARSVTVLAGVQ